LTWFRATREPAPIGLGALASIRYGALAPKKTAAASIALAPDARARAYPSATRLRDPEDIQDLAPDVMRHRIVLTF